MIIITIAPSGLYSTTVFEDKHKQLAEGIIDLKGPMSPQEEDMVVKRLTSLCTDVKYEMAA